MKNTFFSSVKIAIKIQWS